MRPEESGSQLGTSLFDDPFTQSIDTIMAELVGYDTPIVLDDKIACDVCGKRYKIRGLNIHKSTHR